MMLIAVEFVVFVEPASAISPTTTVLVPSNMATVSGTQVVLDASASDNVSVTRVQYELTGGTLTDQVIATATPTIYGWLASWNTTIVANGIYTLQSVATDAAGNTAPVRVSRSRWTTSRRRAPCSCRPAGPAFLAPRRSSMPLPHPACPV